MGRELQTLNGQNKLALWAERISECRNSGQNVKTWCKENGICEQTYYKWQRRLFEIAQAQQKVSFAEVTPVQPVRSGSVAVTVRISGADVSLLQQITYLLAIGIFFQTAILSEHMVNLLFYTAQQIYTKL